MTSSSASSIRIGPYHLGARIGDGGSGEVFRGEGPEGAVEITLVRDPERARTLARVEHPSLAPVIADGIDDERGPYLVTSWPRGTGARRLAREEAIAIAAPIASAIAALHDVGIAHGALSAARVTLTREGDVVVDRGSGSGSGSGGDDRARDVRAIGELLRAWCARPDDALAALIAECAGAAPPSAPELARRLDAMIEGDPVRRRAEAAGRGRSGRRLRRSIVPLVALAIVAAAIAAYTLTRARARPPTGALDDLPAIPDDELGNDDVAFDPPSAPPGAPIVLPALLGGLSPDDAIARADAALAAHPDDAQAMLGRALVHLAAGDPRGLGLLDDAVRAHPDDAHAWASKAYVEVRRGRWREAEDAFARALALDPDDAESLRNRGILEHRLGRARDAYADLRRALALAPDDVDAMYELVQLYTRHYCAADTRALLERIVRLRPGDQRARRDLARLTDGR